MQLRLDEDDAIKEFLDHFIFALIVRVCDLLKLHLCFLVHRGLSTGSDSGMLVPCISYRVYIE